MKTKYSTKQPILKKWYFAFIEGLDPKDKKSWCRLQIVKNGETIFQEVKHKKLVKNAWAKEPEIYLFKFCGVNYNVLLPNPQMATATCVSSSRK